MLPLWVWGDLGSIDRNEGVLRIPQSSSITATSPSDHLVSYPWHSLGGGSYPSTEKQLVYSTAPADWANQFYVLEDQAGAMGDKDWWQEGESRDSVLIAPLDAAAADDDDEYDFFLFRDWAELFVKTIFLSKLRDLRRKRTIKNDI